MRTRSQAFVAACCGLAIAAAVGACDRTKLSGTIRVDSRQVAVGDTVELELAVPAELDGIYWVSWSVQPADAGTLSYHQYDRSAAADAPDARGKLDRVARFTATKAGGCTIEATGFYKQTNPQPIASIRLEVAAAREQSAPTD